MDFFFSTAANVEPLKCSKDGDVQKCISGIDGCNFPVDLNKRFIIEKQLGGGKSGARVFLVRTKADNQKYVLKFYTDAFNEDFTGINNERPFREVITLCTLSGTPGFPCLFEKGCGFLDKPKNKGMYVVMSAIEGTPLFKVDPTKLSAEQALAISMRILILLRAAQELLGADFEHFDLHPDNIIVNFDDCFPTEIQVLGQRLRVSCPTITIIDFDLVHSNYFAAFAGSGFSEEQKAKKQSAQVVAERTLTWAQKWMGSALTSAAILELKKIHNTDIRQWMLISLVLLRANTGKRIKGDFAVCTNVQNCLQTNLHLYNQVFGVGILTRAGQRTVTGAMKRGIEQAEEEGVKRGKVAQTLAAANPLNLLMSSATSARITWAQFEKMVEMKIGHYPNPDSVEVLFRIAFERAFSLKIAEAMIIEVASLNVGISFEGGRPTIQLKFPRPVQVGVIGWNALQTLLKTVSAWLGTYFVGKAQPFWRQEIFCGINNPLEPFFKSVAEVGISYPVYFLLDQVTLRFDGGKFLKVEAQLRISGYVIQFIANRFLQHKSGDMYVFATDIALEGEPNPCVVEGRAEECRQFVQTLLTPFIDILLSKPVIDLLKEVGVPKIVSSLHDVDSDLHLRLQLEPLSVQLRQFAKYLKDIINLSSDAMSYSSIISAVMTAPTTKQTVVDIAKIIADMDRLKVKIGVLDVLQLLGYVL